MSTRVWRGFDVVWWPQLGTLYRDRDSVHFWIADLKGEGWSFRRESLASWSLLLNYVHVLLDLILGVTSLLAKSVGEAPPKGIADKNKVQLVELFN